MPHPPDPHAPLISVLVPIYNHARYIGRCLDSVLEDPHPAKELLVIDDGSSDASYDVAAAWLAKHRTGFVRAELRRQRNAGITRTLNRLVGLARGDHLALLASDDFLLPGGLGSRLAALEAHPDWLGVFGDCIVVNDANAPIMQSGLVDLHGADKRVLSDPRRMPAELILNWSIPGPVLMLRRMAFGSEGVGWYDEHALIEDRDMYLRLLASGRLGFLDQPVAAYRVHERSSNKPRDPGRRLAMLEDTLRTEKRHVGCFPPLLSFALWLNAQRIAAACRLERGPSASAEMSLRICRRLGKLMLSAHRSGWASGPFAAGGRG